ncbi:MAG: ATP-binding protein [Elusimicrobia bacterium]|nr:ATP-binding protein [Elusimicrobiota bacterium]
MGAAMNTPRIRVLLVEDGPHEAALARMFLADSPEAPERFELEVAASFSAACAALGRGGFAAVLLDMGLPGDGGIEAFRRLHELCPECPILVLSSVQDEDAARRAVELGAQERLVRGALDGRLLKRAIRYAIERRRLLAQAADLLARDRDGKIVLDGTGLVRYANAAAADLLSRKPRELLGRPFSHALPGAGRGRLELKRADGEDRIAELWCDEIEWRGAPGRLVTLRDVTDSLQVARLRAEAAEALRTAEAHGNILSCISHELRSPLTTVKMAVSFLQDGSAGPLTPRQAQFLEMASRNIDRQTRIIDNNLDLARLQSGKVRVEFRPVELEVVVSELAHEFAMTGKERLELDIPPGLPAVAGDSDLLTQVLRNLLDNAFRFARQKVVVRACAMPQGVQVSVLDDGAGIPRDRLGELFHRFAQVGRCAKRDGYKGTGLGLAICKEIVEVHKGRIWAESDQGQGARFHFLVPRFQYLQKLSRPA